jgi:hypothetical protein
MTREAKSGEGGIEKGHTEFVSAKGLRVGVEAEEDGLVDKGVLLLRPWALLELLAGGAHDGLNLVAVDQAGDVGVGDLGGGETGDELAIIESNSGRHDIQIVLLVQSRLVKGTEDIVKELERALSPDDESAKMSTRCELKEVESPHINQLNTRQVTECLDDAVVLIIHYQWATALAVAAVAHLALAGP